MKNNNKRAQVFDIIFAGAGLAGLSMAVEMLKHSFFQQKHILLIDRDAKQRNDRTWCFWAEAGDAIPPIVYHSWERCQFLSPELELAFDLFPYRYQLVRGLDFYRWAHQELERWPNIQRVEANIQSMNAKAGFVCTDVGDFSGEFILNSAFTPIPVLPENATEEWKPPLTAQKRQQPPSFTFLLQHFKGWLVQTAQPVFNPETMTLMDFRIKQCGQTRFIYVLPFSPCRALIEFTVFSPQLLSPATYDEALDQYLRQTLHSSQYQILEVEFGVIPMTDYAFPKKAQGRIIHIGTAGGFVKPSSGYAFKRTLQRARTFAAAWATEGSPNPDLLQGSPLFGLLDHVLLRVLRNNNGMGSEIFTHLFKKVPPTTVLRFLDEGCNWRDLLRILNAPPTGPFTLALIQTLIQKLTLKKHR
ncbi:MAG: lycopene cyclase family protein [Saprospiraceae bacterium]|nr:lycopene cyclase family protein [Saprospiraceae bacterium]MDW8482780.1 lycopene cyclase family protein [Saprospiraceae bacterium]